ncbi:MAG: flagellar biosynthesis anti-sigma factor FlgM, partial [Paraclostridium sp.]
KELNYMKITNSYNIEGLNSYKKNINKNTTQKSDFKKDRLEISNEAKKLSESMDTSNSEKITNIKNSINNGTYEINYTELSKRILQKMKG